MYTTCIENQLEQSPIGEGEGKEEEKGCGGMMGKGVGNLASVSPRGIPAHAIGGDVGRRGLSFPALLRLKSVGQGLAGSFQPQVGENMVWCGLGWLGLLIDIHA